MKRLTLAACILTLGLMSMGTDCTDCEKKFAKRAATCLADPNGDDCKKATAAYEKSCVVQPDPTPGPVTPPEPTPIPDPQPIPPCATTVCEPGQRCVEGVGCVVADPTPPPPPVTRCPKVFTGTGFYMKNAIYGNGIDSTLRIVGDPDMCFLIHGVRVNDCHLDGAPDRAGCEMEIMNGCPIWQYSADKITSERCYQYPHPVASCDHFGNTSVRDDPQTPDVFEGEPKECGLQRDSRGDPTAGFWIIGHGKTYFRACLPNGTNCGPWTPGRELR